MSRTWKDRKVGPISYTRFGQWHGYGAARVISAVRSINEAELDGELSLGVYNPSAQHYREQQQIGSGSFRTMPVLFE